MAVTRGHKAPAVSHSSPLAASMAEASESTAGAGKTYTHTSILLLIGRTDAKLCRARNGACYDPQWSGRAQHADGRTSLRGPCERAPPLVRVRVLYVLSLSLSSDTWDGGAQPVATMRAHPGVLLGADDCTLCQRKYQCIEEGETEEAITRCAGPPAAALSTSADTTQHQRRLGSAALTDQDHKCIQVGSVISPCYMVFIYSSVVLCCCRSQANVQQD